MLTECAEQTGKAKAELLGRDFVESKYRAYLCSSCGHCLSRLPLWALPPHSIMWALLSHLSAFHIHAKPFINVIVGYMMGSSLGNVVGALASVQRREGRGPRG